MRALCQCAALLVAGAAAATPRPFPYTYLADTQPKGALEVEQYADLIPTVARSGSTGASIGYLATQLQTELEYGLLDRLELGLYFTVAPAPGDSVAATPEMLVGTGSKQRIKYLLADTGQWPVDVALYGELSENERELEVEMKVILQRRFGLLRIAANLVGEYELYWNGERDFVLAPSAGLTLELKPSFHLGLEYWMHAEFPSVRPPGYVFELGPHHYVGPTVLANFGKIWWSLGAYLRLDDLGRAPEPGDLFSKVWIRTVVGVHL